LVYPLVHGRGPANPVPPPRLVKALNGSMVRISRLPRPPPAGA
jgi:hypothetical protein